MKDYLPVGILSAVSLAMSWPAIAACDKMVKPVDVAQYTGVADGFDTKPPPGDGYSTLYTGAYPFKDPTGKWDLSREAPGSGSHTGVDIYKDSLGIRFLRTNNVDVPVFSVCEGLVEVVTRTSDPVNAGWGNSLTIRHVLPSGEVIYSVYAHFIRLARPWRRGDSVALGQRIGFVGSTGFSTGPHLHFQIDKAAAPVHPYGKFAQEIDPMGLVRANTYDPMALVQNRLIPEVWVPRDTATIQRALDIVDPGGTVRVGPGNYVGDLVIEKPVHLIGEQLPGIAPATIDGSLSNAAAGVFIQSASDVEIKRLRIRDITGDGILMSGTNRATIHQNILTNGGVDSAINLGIGIAMDRSSSNAIFGNYIQYFRGGIEVGGFSTINEVFKNDIRFNRTPQWPNFGIALSGSTNSTVQNNSVEQNGTGKRADAGIVVSITGAHEVFLNSVKNNRVGANMAGVTVNQGSLSNRIAGNASLGNITGQSPPKASDLYDGNANCDDNKWQFNRFKAANQGCIK